AANPRRAGPCLAAPAPPQLVWGPPASPHPPLPVQQQYQPPDTNTRMLLGSFARHLLQLPWPEYPTAKPQSVKIYRALHRMLDPGPLGFGADPRDPVLFIPCYLGQYNPRGELMDAEAPFLYWVVPILPD